MLRDLDTGLIPAVGITPANAPEASVADDIVAGDIAADVDAAGLRLAELHIDRAYLSSELVRDRRPDLAGPQRLGPVRQGPVQHRLRYRAADPPRRGGHAVRGRQDRPVPKGTYAACPLRERCTASSNGRSVSIHPDEALLTELRQRQQTPQGREELRERVQVEHALAHVGHWQGRRARYGSTRKNLFD